MSNQEITVEQIRLMRFKYRDDSAVVRALTELLEYREAEDQAGSEAAIDVPILVMKPRTELERETGTQDAKQWREF